jgi:hypothetical protein
MRTRRAASQPPPALRLPPAQPGPPKSWHPYPFEVADAQAVQSLARGQASADQQTRVLALLINGLCGTYDLSYRPDGDRDTAFAEGKRFVGLQLVKLTAVNISELERIERDLKRR